MTPQILLDWLGRVLMAALFVKAVPGKLTDFSGTVDVIASKGIAEPLAGCLLAPGRCHHLFDLRIGCFCIWSEHPAWVVAAAGVSRAHHTDFSHLSSG